MQHQNGWLQTEIWQVEKQQVWTDSAHIVIAGNRQWVWHIEALIYVW